MVSHHDSACIRAGNLGHSAKAFEQDILLFTENLIPTYWLPPEYRNGLQKPRHPE